MFHIYKNIRDVPKKTPNAYCLKGWSLGSALRLLKVICLLHVRGKLGSLLLICFWGMPGSWSLSLLWSPYPGESILLFFPFKTVIPLSGPIFSRDKVIHSNSVEGIPRDLQGGSYSCMLTVFLKFRSKSGLYHCSVNVELTTFHRTPKNELKHDTGCIRRCTIGQVWATFPEQMLSSPTP